MSVLKMGKKYEVCDLEVGQSCVVECTEKPRSNLRSYFHSYGYKHGKRFSVRNEGDNSLKVIRTR